MKINGYGLVALLVLCACSSSPSETPGERAELTCLELTTDAPSTLTGGEQLQLTVQNTCEAAFTAQIGGAGPGFRLEDDAGASVWQGPGEAFLDSLTPLTFAALETKTFRVPFTTEAIGEGAVPDGSYTLYGVLRVAQTGTSGTSETELRSDGQTVNVALLGQP